MAASSMCALRGFICSVVALLLNIVSIASPHWVNADGQLHKIDIGLFIHCDVRTSSCGGMHEISSIVDVQEVGWFRATQATYLVAVVGTLLTAVLDMLVLIRFFDKGSFKVISVINFITLMSGFAALLMFGLHYKDVFTITDTYNSEAYIGYSFYTAVFGCAVLLVAFIFHGIEASNAAAVLKNMQHRLTIWSTPYTLFVDQEQ